MIKGPVLYLLPQAVHLYRLGSCHTWCSNVPPIPVVSHCHRHWGSTWQHQLSVPWREHWSPETLATSSQPQSKVAQTYSEALACASAEASRPALHPYHGETGPLIPFPAKAPAAARLPRDGVVATWLPEQSRVIKEFRIGL